MPANRNIPTDNETRQPEESMSISELFPLKTCTACKQEKPRAEFNKKSKSFFGLQSLCRQCNKNKNREHYRKNKAAYNKRSTEWRQKNQEAWKEIQCRHKSKWGTENARRYRLNNPEKNRAHRIATDAMRRGRLVKKPCCICGDKTVDAHHPDYSKPLEVIWLCRKHHAEAHSKK